jgi:uncharacterized protein YfaS (alpha-2-macroglobulin family)
MEKTKKDLQIECSHQTFQQEAVRESPSVKPLAETNSLFSNIAQMPEEPAEPTDRSPSSNGLPLPKSTVEIAFEPSKKSPLPPEAPESLPRVERVTPDGPASQHDYPPHEIRITYSQPVTELGSIENLVIPEVTLEPEIGGVWQWDDPQQLVFLPDRAFPRATEFTLTFQDGRVHRFSTAPPQPKVYGHSPQSDDTVIRPTLELVFDIPVDLDSVADHVLLTNEPPKKVDSYFTDVLSARKQFFREKRTVQTFALQPVESDEPTSARFTPIEDLPRTTRLYVKLAPGVKAKAGPLPCKESSWFSFQTVGPLAFVGLQGEPKYHYGQPQTANYFFRFNNRLKSFEEAVVQPTGLKASPISVPGDPYYSEMSCIVFEGALDPGEYVITVRGVTDIHGQTLEEVTAELKVEPGEPQVLAPTEQMVCVPLQEPHFAIHAYNTDYIRVMGWRVEPVAKWKLFPGLFDEHNFDRVPPEIQTKISEKFSSLGVKAGGDWSNTLRVESREMSVDLSPYLPESGVGHVVLNIKPCREDGTPNPDSAPVIAWIQVTGIDLAAFTDGEEWEALALDGVSGQPFGGLELLLDDGEKTTHATTDESGWARLQRASEPDYNTSFTLMAMAENETAFLPNLCFQSHSTMSSPWLARPDHMDQDTKETTIYAWTDRGLYRPGEQVSVKGWSRQRGSQRSRLEIPEETRLTYTLASNMNPIAEGSMEISPGGTFSLTVELPKSAEYGQSDFALSDKNCSVNLNLGERYYGLVEFQVSSFRPPEFEVQVEFSKGAAVRGESLQAGAKAAYFSGGGLATAPVEWRTTARTISYTPAGRNEYFFGPWRPRWWRWFQPEDDVWIESQSQTDSRGRASVTLEFLDGEKEQTLQVETTAVVTDLNHQQWTDSCRALLHSSSVCIGIRTSDLLLAPGRPFLIQVLVTDLGGQAVAGRRVEVSYGDQVHRIQSGEEPAEVQFEQDGGGYHLVSARVWDTEERVSCSTLPLWTWGRACSRPDTEEVVVVLDKQSYGPGEVAQLLVLSPFAQATGVLRVGSDRPFYEKRFRVSGGEARLEVPVSEEMVPLSELRVDLLNLEQSGHAFGRLELEVPPDHHWLVIRVNPDHSQTAPDVDTAVTVEVLDSDNRPVSDAEVALVVVDEAILYLGEYDIPEPLQAFYPRQVSPLSQTLLHSHRVLPGLDQLVAQRQEIDERGVMYCLAGSGPDSSPQTTGVFPRHQFAALAHFEPAARTDAEGRVRVGFTLPSNLTRYRVTAVASAGTSEFGLGESSITTSRSLMVRPSPPRFLTAGDRFDLPVLVQNGTSLRMTVRMAWRARGLELDLPEGFEVEIPPGARRDVTFSARVQTVDKVELTVVARSGELQDSVQLDIPVVKATLMETMACYGHLDGGVARLNLRVPQAVDGDRGGLDLSFSTTALAHLDHALVYLYEYPYNCAEQRASRILGLLSAQPYLDAFDSGLPRGEELRTVVQNQVDELIAQQDGYEGGWGFWPGSRTDGWVSAHATHALLRAHLAGYRVSSASLKQAEVFLLKGGSEEDAADLFGSQGGDEGMPAPWAHEVRAYGLWLLQQLSPAVSWQDEARSLSLQKDLPLGAWGWLLPLLKHDREASERGLRLLRNHLDETSSSANFLGGSGSGVLSWILGSAARQDAVLLNALIEVTPDDPIIVKLVRGLLAHRQGGQWANTQENIFSVLVLGRYFQKYEAKAPDVVARAWLDEQHVLDESFLGRDKEQRSLQIPMAFLQHQKPDSLTVSHQGHGRLYYRAALNYASPEPDRKLFHGFRVGRQYFGAKDEDDVVYQDGVWKIRAGALVHVQLRIQSPIRHHVALVDRLPAGLEPEEPSLRQAAAHGYGWEHYEIRDHEVRVFSRELHGSVVFVYGARATTKGTFLASSCSVEEMYQPETFGRTAAAQVVVY